MNKLEIKDFVYVAGPMEDCSEDYMTSWRNKVSDQLEASGISVLDPTRRVSFHDQITDLQDNAKSRNTCQRIFKQDMQDIANSKVILADVRRCSGRGTGTSMELMFGHIKNKIIILVADEKDFIHPFYESMYTEKHYNFEDAIEACKSYY